MRTRACLALSMLASAPAAAQPVIASAAPERVAITLYRAPDRPASHPISRDDPAGFALVTETRTVELPAGPAVIRFEGVAGNILPESAIVSGMPADVAEKNLDADLLSPRTLYDRALGRRVVLRRTDPATGRVREEQATIRSSAAGAAVLRLADGHEALRCSGLPETIVHQALPDGLAARPTLSIATEAPRAVRATITLSYLAGGFDWQADYVLTLPGGGSAREVLADLFAWVTLASSDVTGFPAARMQLVAGRPNREGRPAFGQFDAGPLMLRCWPVEVSYGRTIASPPPPPLAPPPPPAAMMEDVVVTAQRGFAIARAPKALEVAQGELGDFKLYTVPLPTDIAARGQKQVALLARGGVKVRLVHVGNHDADFKTVAREVQLHNRTADGLGVPLPAGEVAVFQDGGERPLLLGLSSTADKAVGERAEIVLPPAPGVTARVEPLRARAGMRRQRLIVTNANPWPVAYEARFPPDLPALSAPRLVTRDGRRSWGAVVPANGTATLDYSWSVSR